MNTDKLAAEIQKLTIEREKLAVLMERFNTLQLRGERDAISVSIKGKVESLEITGLAYTNGNYNQQVIRGREMILLGVKKVMAAKVKESEQKIKFIEEAIKSEVLK